MLFMSLMTAVVMAAQVVADPVESVSIVEFFKTNWIPLIGGILGLAEVVVRLTPSEKDNSILKKITDILFFFIPNLSKGGGVHKE